MQVAAGPTGAGRALSQGAAELWPPWEAAPTPPCRQERGRRSGLAAGGSQRLHAEGG